MGIMLGGFILILDLLTKLGLFHWTLVVIATILINIAIVIHVNKKITKFEKKKTSKTNKIGLP